MISHCSLSAFVGKKKNHIPSLVNCDFKWQKIGQHIGKPVKSFGSLAH